MLSEWLIFKTHPYQNGSFISEYRWKFGTLAQKLPDIDKTLFDLEIMWYCERWANSLYFSEQLYRIP